MGLRFSFLRFSLKCLGAAIDQPLSAFLPQLEVSLGIPIKISLWELQVGLVSIWLGLIGLMAIVLSRLPQVEPELIRKVVHIGTGNIILLAWWLQIPAEIGIGASILFSILTLLSYRFPVLPGLDSMGRQSLGTFFYAVSIGLLITWFWSIQPGYAAIGVLVMTWGDGLAALIGQNFGQHRYQVLGMQKSWEGSLTMLIVSFGVSSAVLLAIQGQGWQTWIMAIGLAIVATLLETFSKFGLDNLTVPLGTALLGFGLHQWMSDTLHG